jgi:hypothetical protein
MALLPAEVGCPDFYAMQILKRFPRMTLRPRLRSASTSAAFAILRHRLDALSPQLCA